MLRANAVLQELRANAEGKCVLQELRANVVDKCYSARAEGECARDIIR